MDTIIDNLYFHDADLFILKIYKPWINDLKKKAKIKINHLKSCIWCHERFDYYVYGLCIECCNEYNII
jgi:hypothetical protein